MTILRKDDAPRKGYSESERSFARQDEDDGGRNPASDTVIDAFAVVSESDSTEFGPDLGVDEQEDVWADSDEEYDPDDAPEGVLNEDESPHWVEAVVESDDEFDAGASVEAYEILSVGHRPVDHMGRDCLFGALHHDHRVPWFGRYLRKPHFWMESLVAHLPSPADRKQALQYVVLHFLHKLHLRRLIDYVRGGEYEADEPPERMLKVLTRLWGCTPYTVEVARKGQGDSPAPGCGLARLCPWCHARKVVQLYGHVNAGPLRGRSGTYLFLGKVLPFPEPAGGVAGRYELEDAADYRGGKVRNHWGRYFGRNRKRLQETRDQLAETLFIQVDELGMGFRSGLWTHQLGSAQLGNGQRTFLHDVAMVGDLDDKSFERMEANPDGRVFWGGRKATGFPARGDVGVDVLWLPLPLDDPAALRVALAGSSGQFAVSRLGLPEKWFRNHAEYRTGIRGALSWQPTFLLDDRMWFAYEQATRKQRLYHPFGSWRKALAEVSSEARTSVDRKFKKKQAERMLLGRQQKGNQRRRCEARDRRGELLSVAQNLWSRVVGEQAGGRGPSFA